MKYLPRTLGEWGMAIGVLLAGSVVVSIPITLLVAMWRYIVG